MNIRYSEIFFSFQGEAEHAGVPAVWLRFFGCNLNCSGFGQHNPTDPSTYELPYQDFDASQVKSVDELPVWKKGCDSSYSWSAKFRHLVPNHSVEEVCDKIIDALRNEHNPEGRFIHPKTGQPMMLCFTGGEPMLYQKAMQAIVEELQRRENSPELITVETNATQPFREEFREFVRRSWAQWHFAMSPKLFNVSGEAGVVYAENIIDYTSVAQSCVLKFVVNGTQASWDELDGHLKSIEQALVSGEANNCYLPEVWVMPVGATEEAQSDISELCMEAMRRGFFIATRNHVYVFGNMIGR